VSTPKVLDGADPVDHEPHVPQVVVAAQAMAERALERRRKNLAASSSSEPKATSPNKRPRVCSITPEVPSTSVAPNSVLTSFVPKDSDSEIIEAPPMKLARLSKDVLESFSEPLKVPNEQGVQSSSFPEIVKIHEPRTSSPPSAASTPSPRLAIKANGR